MSANEVSQTSDRDGMRAGAKNLVVLCDGTANQVTVCSPTNLLRLARRLDKAPDSPKRQLVFYDPGLGTESAPGALTAVGRATTKVLGLAFGYGVSKDIADAYAFLVQHYEPGDRIYIFGFSRGAYTARAVTGLLGRVGLLERGVESLIPYAVRYYQDRDSHQLNFFKRRFARTYAHKWGEVAPDIDAKRAGNDSKGVIPVHFLGVWDTVKSIGTLRRQIMLPDTDWLPNMMNGRHAVALDERRSQYVADLWLADTDSGHVDRVKAAWWRRQACLHQDVETMWFAGVHADVGGGYGPPGEKDLIKTRKKLTAARDKLAAGKGKKRSLEDRIRQLSEQEKSLKKNNEEGEQYETGLAHISLEWMADAAEKHGLSLDRETDKSGELVLRKPLTPDSSAKLHDPMSGPWRLLGSTPRTVPPGGQIHPTVHERMRADRTYKPAANGFVAEA